MFTQECYTKYSLCGTYITLVSTFSYVYIVRIRSADPVFPFSGWTFIYHCSTSDKVFIAGEQREKDRLVTVPWLFFCLPYTILPFSIFSTCAISFWGMDRVRLLLVIYAMPVYVATCDPTHLATALQ